MWQVWLSWKNHILPDYLLLLLGSSPICSREISSYISLFPPWKKPSDLPVWKHSLAVAKWQVCPTGVSQPRPRPVLTNERVQYQASPPPWQPPHATHWTIVSIFIVSPSSDSISFKSIFARPYMNMIQSKNTLYITLCILKIFKLLLSVTKISQTNVFKL